MATKFGQMVAVVEALQEHTHYLHPDMNAFLMVIIMLGALVVFVAGLVVGWMVNARSRSAQLPNKAN
jgi:hypothetical protein